ncbi:MAG: DMT family transporter [Clostridia bacterium]|nr:DMT family transporter [Clostridia bacterium]
MKISPKLARAMLFGAALIWGSSFFVMKNTLDAVPPNLLLAIRFTAAGILMSAIFFPKLKKLNRTYLWQGAIIGALYYTAYCTQTIGLNNTTPGKNAFLTAIYCVLVPFLFWFVSKKRPDLWNLAAAFICIVGIGFVSLDGNFRIGFGDAMTLVGGFFYAAHMVAVALFTKDRDAILVTILQFYYCALFSWIAHLLFEDTPASIGSDAILALAFLAVCCTAIAMLFQNVGQKYTPPAPAAIILSLESVFGVFFSVIAYNEQLTVRLILGFALIFVAVIISETKLSFITERFSPQKNPQ